MDNQKVEDGCLLPEGASKALPGQKAVQAALGEMASPFLQGVVYTGMLIEGVTGQPMLMRHDAAAALANIDACAEGSLEGRVGKIAASIGGTVLTTSGPMMAAGVGQEVLGQMGVDPVGMAANAITQQIERNNSR